MRLIFTAIILLLAMPGLDSQELTDRINFTDDKGLKQGYWEQKYPNGNIRYKGVFKNDHPVGELIRYFPGGSKMAVLNFCDEGRRADAELFYQNGGLAGRGIFIDEQKDSVWKYFSYYDNQLASTETYNMGVKEGLSAVYYPDGQMSESFWYQNDSRNGPWKQYYQNGSVRLEADFVDDERHGEFRFYGINGRVEIEGNYSQNRMHGEWIYYDQPGDEATVINYIEGVPENEEELIDEQQEMFRQIEQMRGRIPEPDESDLFNPGMRR